MSKVFEKLPLPSATLNILQKLCQSITLQAVIRARLLKVPIVVHMSLHMNRISTKCEILIYMKIYNKNQNHTSAHLSLQASKNLAEILHHRFVESVMIIKITELLKIWANELSVVAH